ncbi:MAG: bifunctional folylpolyglutamate synthase/dihydrofolate synthase [Bacteroidaceae bacterium]|nr:bifunctional folylpolyglutamate synthase/dihydrofolate synthase [Bacteroidaceae bacterium]
MTYQDAIDYLYRCAPAFHNIGAGAYKEGLANTLALDEHFGHPHRQYRTIHVGGTNGKGSCSHTLAAILQSAGYRVGLYTSPHLLDFSERIRVNGKPIPHDYVADFVEHERAFFEPLHPSFFEVTTALAFRYFADERVDVAVVEVGLGGRLDCTNIIQPDLSVITNISLEHTALLGDTLEKIAFEKAGIIKPSTPVVIGETHPETRPVFEAKARQQHSPIIFADSPLSPHHPENPANPEIPEIPEIPDNPEIPEIPALPVLQLKGPYQQKNAHTILCAVSQLRRLGYALSDDSIREGFAHVCDLTGLMGRWQQVGEHPTVICDIGHNAGGLQDNIRQLKQQSCRTLRIVLGFVDDKDIRPVLNAMPHNATYYLSQPSTHRALKSHTLYALARCYGQKGREFKSVGEAFAAAKKDAAPDDFIFVGGSNFVVADFLQSYDSKVTSFVGS